MGLLKNVKNLGRSIGKEREKIWVGKGEVEGRVLGGTGSGKGKILGGEE